MLATNISSDRPIDSLEEDRYGLKHHFVPRLARIALDWPSKDGLVIGLFGSWGIGKTSVLNMFRNFVEQKREQYPNVLIASFNPWFYEDTGALVTSFFATIAAELGGKDDKPWKQAATALKAMGTFLTAASKGVSLFGINVDLGLAKDAIDASVKSLKEVGEFSGGLAGLAELADGGQKKLEQHRATVVQALNILGESRGRIVILIDDVDRLDKKELLSLLRLVRIVADLPYMTLVLAMDDNRIRDVLSAAISEGYGKGYLDKIIQVPLHIPLPTREETTAELIAQLKAAFDVNGIPLPRELNDQSFWAPAELQVLVSVVRTPRDMRRYINGIRTLLLSGEDPDIHATDAALIEALHIFYPDVYDRVRRHKDFLTESSKNRSSLLLGEGFDNREEVREKLSAEFDLIVRGGATPLETKAEGIVRNLLNCLFGDVTDPELHRDHEADTANRRIRSPKTFDNYFRYASPPGIIKRSELESYFKRILGYARESSITGIAAILVDAFNGRDERAIELLTQDLGQMLLPLEPEQLELIGKGVLEVSARLTPESNIALMEKVLGAILKFRSDDDDGGLWTKSRVVELAVGLLQPALLSKLSIADSHVLLKRLVSSLSEEGFREIKGKWIERIDKELREGDFLGGAEDVEVVAKIFWSAWMMIGELGKDSPVPREEFSSHLTEYVLRHPERLPQALFLISEVPANDIPVLLSSTRTKEKAVSSIQNLFGSYERIRPAYEAFLSRNLKAGRYARLLEDFNKLRSDATSSDGSSAE